MSHHIPEGFHALTPFLHVQDGDAFIEWAKAALGATVRFVRHEEGKLRHGEIVIEGCVLELSDAGEDWPSQPASFHLYVPDPDATYARALEAGAKSLYEVTDHDYGERSGGVADAWGNHWYLARVTDPVLRSPEPS